ncbi:peptide/nickel transport system substrate-binding protein [Sulfobacillus thermosulfidooxidans DSM 9293]|uniref:Peptide/nickel transport system substrate-binding protein n=1 Tax=Sulfobacillus thermosulfidooxidans (strain DSM 9293 / VKM B-1269 / AT-1) TaxID=929705 RepID=A0A1W1WJB3_SULTA|nr:peptide ABC transporter substrate-binding protein [Sulfobacillus thermosulfidooxidans]SMC05843.1 peptide/nickel transport system substrate-binding protein [Sulfobacillus thermosulfidooxidans DSM 9293]
MSIQRPLTWLATGLTLSAIAAGCGSPSTTTSQGTTTSKAAVIANGTVVDGIFEEPDNLNPILGPNMTFSAIVKTSMFHNLFQVLPNGTLEPDIATVVPTVANGGISANGLVYTFHLKQGLKWSNGQPITSKDVWETYKLITNPAVNAVTKLGWSDVKTFKILSPYSFQLILNAPFAPLIDTVFTGSSPGILPYSVFKNIPASQVNTAHFNVDPSVSDGPFMFKSWVPGVAITVQRNPYWWGPKPKASQIVFKVIPNENTLLADAQSHAINVYYFAPIEQAQPLSAISGAKVFFTSAPNEEMAVVNMRDPVLDNVKVRQALEYAIDRPALVSKVWMGHATLVGADQPPDAWAYDPQIKPYPYNPQKADALLTAAGWKMGSNGFRTKNGQELTLIYSTTAGNPYRDATERLLQFWLKQVGINLVIRNYPANEFFGTILPDGKPWDLAEYEYGQGLDPGVRPQVMYEPGGAENFGAYNNPAVTSLLQAQSTLVTEAQRRPYLFRVEQILHNDLPDLFYYSPQGVSASINMSGYQPNPWSVDTWNCWDWQLTK